MKNIKPKNLIKRLIPIIYKAGTISIKYSKKLKVFIKDDKTPVTNGDLEVDKILQSFLKKISPSIEIVSEETIKKTKTKKRKTFWLIDPIDGTSSYIKGGSEYTINVGLIINQKPAAGIIYAPKKKRLFYSYGKNEAYEILNKMIASSEFDLYSAKPRAKEWDYAAGHAIAESAGAIIRTFQNKKILYGKKGFKNPSLLVRRNSSIK